MSEPIPMLLWCPSCGARHVDAGEFATKPHHTHACQSCGMVWRPAIVPTCGVLFLPGFKDGLQRPTLEHYAAATDVLAGALGLAIGERPGFTTPTAKERNAAVREDVMAYRDRIRDETALFLGRENLGGGGHAVILLCSIFNDYRTGDLLHDQTLAAGLGLAFDLWSQREAQIEAALKGPKAQA